MDAAITRTERVTQCALPQCKLIDHRARHMANARQWRRQYLDCLNGKLPDGAEAHAIWEAMLRECKLGNINPDDVLPAPHSLN